MSARPRQEQTSELPGLIELPPGKIAAVATYLEMWTPSHAAGEPSGARRFEPLAGNAFRYRRLFAAVGQPWLWFSRALLSDTQISEIIDDPAVEALALVRDGRDIGIVELDFRRDGECELAFLGLVPDAIGSGLGRELAAEGIRRAFARPIARLWLHTCTLDHPAALRFYMKAGFTPYRRAVEIADDPRLTGKLPSDAAGGFPIL